VQFVILSARTGWHTDELCRALAARGHVAIVLRYESLVARLGSPRSAASLTNEQAALFHADAVLARIIPSGSLEQIIFRVDALHWIEDHGVLVINSPRAIERSVDKFYTDALLHEAGLDTPETVVCETTADALAAVRRFGDAVIKPIFGSMGCGLVRVSDPDVAFRIVRALDQARPSSVQRYIEHDGRDIRVFVVDGRVLGAIERRALPGDWRANVARGADAVPFELPEAWAQMAVRAAGNWRRLCGRRSVTVAGRPRVRARGQRIPGWEGLQRATGLDVAGASPRMSNRAAGGRGAMTSATALDVGVMAQLACLLEVSAPKPGNVLPGRHFADAR
jgi:RimK family alpha-L-glutamate ligase